MLVFANVSIYYNIYITSKYEKRYAFDNQLSEVI